MFPIGAGAARGEVVLFPNRSFSADATCDGLCCEELAVGDPEKDRSLLGLRTECAGVQAAATVRLQPADRRTKSLIRNA